MSEIRDDNPSRPKITWKVWVYEFVCLLVETVSAGEHCICQWLNADHACMPEGPVTLRLYSQR